MKATNLTLVCIEGTVRVAGLLFCAWIARVVATYVSDLLARRLGNEAGKNAHARAKRDIAHLRVVVTLTVLCLVLFAMAQLGALAIVIRMLVLEVKQPRPVEKNYVFDADSVIFVFLWWYVFAMLWQRKSVVFGFMVVRFAD